MDLATVWFILIAGFWTAYFVLEGFDFGVGMLLGLLPRDEHERRTMLSTIGPVWDGNEVWLVVVGAATFAAFPLWYATMFSGFYLALLLLLVLLIVRAVGFEWRERGEHRHWLGFWRWSTVVASFGAPFVWGVALANLVAGVPIDADGNFAGDFADLFSPFSVAAGLDVVALFAFHGAAFLAVRTGDALCERAATTARRLSVPVLVAGTALLAWIVAMSVDRNDKDVLPPAIPAIIGAIALLAATVLVWRRTSGWAFATTAAATAALVATIFTSLYPRVLVSHPTFANSLTVEGAASQPYTLKVLTVVGVLLIPAFALYQGWAYYVLRGRLGVPASESRPHGRSTA